MSEIDFQDSVFGRDLALSERESVNGARESKDFGLGEELFQQACSTADNNLFGSMNGGFRMSQTTTSKRSSPVKINLSMLRSSYNPLERPIDLRQNDDLKGQGPVFLQKIGDQEVFECQHQFGCGEVCQICKGVGFVRGNNRLIKFFEYLIGFKMGANGSYKEKRLSGKSQTDVNNFCRDFYNNRPQQPNQNIRGTAGNCSYKYSNRASEKPVVSSRSSVYGEGRASEYRGVNVSQRFSTKTQAKVYRKAEVVEELNNIVTVHENYVCDMCSHSPIVGVRYHCNECADFDECESCYSRYAHAHMMEKIEKCGKGKQLECVVNLMGVTGNCGRVSLRPPPSIKMGPQCGKTTRSAIR